MALSIQFASLSDESRVISLPQNSIDRIRDGKFLDAVTGTRKMILARKVAGRAMSHRDRESSPGLRDWSKV
jgi:hypothetical protein